MSATTTPENRCGLLLRHWRSVRRMSQMDLALRAGVSTRHLSFVESGRARASRDMLCILADALDVPLRERNALLDAGGFNGSYKESAIEGADLALVRRALGSMLTRLDPYPCTLLDRFWNVKEANGGATRLLGAIMTPEELAAEMPLNAARLLFSPTLRNRILDWETTACSFLQRLHREALGGDDAARSLVNELLALPGVPAKWRVPDLDRASLPVLPLEILHGDVRLSFFTTITMLGTPLDVTLEELRIETYFPANDATEAALRALAR